jgi:NAD(P)H dehydrogenase (quinone)
MWSEELGFLEVQPNFPWGKTSGALGSLPARRPAGYGALRKVDCMSIVITGASGQLGRSTAELVLDRVPAFKVILTTRHPEALSAFAGRGAKVRRADFDRPETLAEAFASGERLLLISTDDIGHRAAQHQAAIEAAREAGVRHVAYTSYLNPVAGNPAVITPSHRDTEEALRESGLAWTALRNAFYAEYQVPAGSQAIATGQLIHNNGEGRIAYISREDCAAAAAAVLTTEGHEGKAYDITGPEPLGQGDVAALLSEVSGRPVETVAVDDEAFIQGLTAAGVPESAARGFASYGRAIREGYIDQTSDAVEDLTGSPPRSLREVFEAHRGELLRAG